MKSPALLKLAILINFCLIQVLCFASEPGKWHPDKRSISRDNGVKVHEAFKKNTSKGNTIKPNTRSTQIKTGENSIRAYAWNAYPGHSGVAMGPVSITLPDGQISSIMEVIPDIILMSAADFIKDTWIATSLEENSGLYEINTSSGYFQLIGRTGVGINALAYDAVSDVLYGAGADEMFSYLFTINPENGVTQSLGRICEGTIVGLSADMDGNLYGISLYNNSLYQINTTSGEGKVIGQTGLNLQYAQDIAYDRDNFILYGTLFTEDGQGGLYEMDTNTGNATLLKDIGAELTAFAIPYTNPEEGAPEAPENPVLTAGALGALETLINWTNPSETNTGTSISKLDEVLIYRDNALIHTVEDPEPGAPMEFTDQHVPGKGIVHYKIAAVNEKGMGAFARSSVYIGPDVPAAVNNLKLSAPDGEGVLSWDAPDKGLHEGYFAEEGMTYKIIRFPDQKVMETSWQDCSYSDADVPETGNYFYSVTASNDAGVGGTAVSNIALLGDKELLFFEDFDGMEGPLPAGWEIIGKGTFNWRIMESKIAGGEVPEMCFTFLPIFEGLSRLVTPEIILYESQYLILSLNTRMINFTYLFKNEKIGIDISFDNGDSWQEVWGFLADTDYGPEELQLQLKLPADKEKIRLAFRFQGDSGNIMEWSLDNIKLRKARAFDLKATALRGNHFLVAGESNIHQLSVLNQGYQSQDQYTVSLFNNKGSEIAKAYGKEVAFGEEAEFDFEWTSETADPEISSLYARVDPHDNQAESISPELQVYLLPHSKGIAQVGDAKETTGKFEGIPFDFDTYGSISQSIYFPEEMETIGGQIVGLAIYNHFITAQTQPVKIFMGLTRKEKLTEGFISPDEQDLVFDGDIFFPSGQNPVLIMLDEAYSYNGGEDHLVISFVGSYDETLHPPTSRFLNTYTPNKPDRTRTFSSTEEGVLSSISAYPTLGDLHSAVPNTTFIIDGADMGTLQGEVLTSADTALEGAQVKINATAAITQTKTDGSYRFPRIMKGEQLISAGMKGYYTASETIAISENEEATLNFSLEPLPKVSLAGRVTFSDKPESGIEGATIRLNGYDQKETTSTADGQFIISEIFGDERYTLSISYDGYDTHEQLLVLGKEDMNLGNIVLTENAHPPFNVNATLQNENASVSWEKAGSARLREFRYDSGIVDKLLGDWPSDFNTVYGSVYHNHAMLEEISWQLRHETNDYFPHPFVTIWVIGLNEDGKPDPEKIIYKKEQVPNTNKQWCRYRLSQPIVMEEGFFIGISANDHIGIAIDTGSDAGYPFPDNTHYVIKDITSGESFTPLEEYFDGLTGNLFIRATGWDYENGSLYNKPGNDYVSDSGMEGHNIFSGKKNHSAHTFGEKAFEHYKVFRLRKEQVQDDMSGWTELSSNTNGLSFIDEEWSGLPSGEWVYAIVAVYTNGVFSEASFSNILTKDMHASVSIQVSANTGEAPTGAFLTLSHEEGDPEHIYSSAVPPNGTVTFPNIWKGYYHLEISLEGYHTFTSGGLPFNQDDNNYHAELEEHIAEPYNLKVETRDLEPGQAVFSWNNAFIGELWEGFEAEFPPAGWLKLNPIGGDGWSVIQAGTSPIPGWEGGEAIPAPDGEEYMAIMTYSYGGSTANDQWLITPELTISEDNILSFYARYWPDNFDDNLEILISATTQNDREAFDIVVDKLNFSAGSNTNWQQYTYTLTDYVASGSKIFIAFREYAEDNVEDGAVIMLDNVFVGPEDTNPVGQKAALSSFTTPSSGLPVTPKAFQSYNVFLDDLSEPVATGVNETEYLFAGLSNDTHYAGVQSVYTTGLSEIVTIEFNMEYMFSVTFIITDDDGNAITGAQITFDGEILDAGNYLVQNLEPGTYPYQITFPGYETAEGEIHISDADQELNIVLTPENVGLPPAVDGEIVIYPNPARDMLYLKAASTIKNVKMFDMSGNLVINRTFSDTQGNIGISHLRPGIYLLRIMTAHAACNTRVQIIR